MRVNIIGGGLAGCALAYALKKAGAEPVIYEASSELASGASGNDVGIYNPRFAAQMDALSRFYSDAFFGALEVFEEFGEAIDWSPCGVLTLLTDARQIKRLHKTAASWGWPEEEMRLVDARDASDIAGVEIPCECLYLPRAGHISPKKLCHEYARGVEVHLNTKVEDFNALDGDATVLACGLGCLNFEVAADLPLKPVRGQVSYIEEHENLKNLKVSLGYGGHLAPAHNGTHCLGATFQPWLDHDRLMDGDDLTNLEKLYNAIPSLVSNYKVVKRRAGLRVTSKDHFPVVGQLSDGNYISSAHGSYGILSSLISAKIMADIVVGHDEHVSSDVMRALDPYRFL